MLAVNDESTIKHDVNVKNHPDYKTEVEHLENTIKEMKEEIDRLTVKGNEIYQKQKKLLQEKDKESRRDLYTYSNIQEGNSLKAGEIESSIMNPENKTDKLTKIS